MVSDSKSILGSSPDSGGACPWLLEEIWVIVSQALQREDLTPCMYTLVWSFPVYQVKTRQNMSVGVGVLCTCIQRQKRGVNTPGTRG